MSIDRIKLPHIRDTPNTTPDATSGESNNSIIVEKHMSTALENMAQPLLSVSCSLPALEK
jgi:hypothetical protein